MKRIFRHWRIVYAICCLFYVGWIIHVGTNEFDRINSQYRVLVKQLEAGSIRAAALEELTVECRRAAGSQGDLQVNECDAWAPVVVEARQEIIAERRLLAKKRGAVKLVLFYAFFIAIFLLAPPILIYLLIVGIVLLYKNVKIVR